MNKIYAPGATEPLTKKKITEIVGAKKVESSAAVERLVNGNICDCKCSGEFEFMSKNPSNTTGPYLRCRKCGCITPFSRRGESS